MPAASLVGTIVGGCYRLLGPLGEGGMGVIYEAQHLRLGGKVAIKILSARHAADPKLRDRFKREARAASQIRHPNVVQITDFGDAPNGSVFIAMELLEGRDLHHVIRTHAPVPFPWPRAVHLLAQAADALAAAHRSGVVHRDVKPSNIFVLEGPGVSDFVKLLDFGIAKVVAATPTADSVLLKNLTNTGEIFGTAKYMAPEQAYGSANDPRMDVYSLGVVAYELLTGRVPFTGQSNFAIIMKHVGEAPRPLRELRPELPASLEAVVLRTLEKKPENRPATMEELGQALRQLKETNDRAGSSVPRARAHTSTDANTLPRTRRKDLMPVDATTVHVRVPVAAAAPPVAVSRVATAPAPAAAPVVRKTIAAVAPLAHPPAPPFGAHPPVAPPPVAQPLAPPPAASPTDNLARMQAPTGPLARRRGSAFDDTSRELATRPPSATIGMKRLVTFAVLGAIAVGTSSTTAVILIVGSNPTTDDLADAQVSTPSPAVDHAPLPTPPTAAVPAFDDASSGGPDEPSAAARPPEPPAAAPPAPALDVTPPPATRAPTNDPKPSASKPSSTKPRPKATPVESDPKRETIQRIGQELQRKIKRDCAKLGEGKEVVIKLETDPGGRVIKKSIGALGPLRTCILGAIGTPKLPPDAKLMLSPVIGVCVNPFAANPKCK